jgi:molybdenum cofactor cytidylyltransferase
MNVWAVVLAAGESRRFGRDKLTEAVGTTFLSHPVLSAVARARESGDLQDGVVVVRDRGSRVAESAAALQLRVEVNRDAARGMGTSLRAGLARVERTDPTSEGVLVFLADQPLVTLEVIRSVLSAASASNAEVVRPQYAVTPEVPGHPVFLRRNSWSFASELTGDRGFQDLIRSSSVVTQTIRLSGSNPDIDTPEDLEALKGLLPDA